MEETLVAPTKPFSRNNATNATRAHNKDDKHNVNCREFLGERCVVA
jgi:hypothetical protein